MQIGGKRSRSVIPDQHQRIHIFVTEIIQLGGKYEFVYRFVFVCHEIRTALFSSAASLTAEVLSVVLGGWDEVSIMETYRQ